MRIAVTGVAFLSVVCVGAMMLAGCGSRLETSHVERSIKDGIAKQTRLPVRSVSCPNDVKAKKGDTFRCTAVSAKGDRVVVLVTQLDDKGHVTWRVE
jgi:hypothetical protein